MFSNKNGNLGKNRFTSLFLNDDFIFVLIIINSITIFLEGFVPKGSLKLSIDVFDTVITIMFLLEAITKIVHFGWRRYIASNWNKLDFILVVISLPSVYLLFSHFHTTNLQFILVFRILRISRVFRFFRFFKFLPGVDELFKGISRALRSSIFILVGLAIYNFVVAILSCHMFSDVAPELFGDPLKAFYTTFRIFTIEGWYEIPEKIVLNIDSGLYSIAIKMYFILILVTGGILGLSLINSILVDSMVADNNDTLEHKVDLLNKKLDALLSIQNLPTALREELDMLENIKK